MSQFWAGSVLEFGWRQAVSGESARVSFERLFSMRDKNYNMPACRTYSESLRRTFWRCQDAAVASLAPNASADLEELEQPDIMESRDQGMAGLLLAESRLMAKLNSPESARMGSDQEVFLDHLPQELDDRDQLAYHWVPKAMTRILLQRENWKSYKKNATTYVKRKS